MKFTTLIIIILAAILGGFLVAAVLAPTLVWALLEGLIT